MSARIFTVLSRQWCHLCHELIAALEPLAVRHGWRIEVVDVDEAPDLEARWNERVPVLLAGEREICHHRLDTEAVVAFCKAFPLESNDLPG
ncbi:MAG: glutaredoxin family protein [Azoarcus sp.]|nr:glutaredoxin family protein [Azoarcus sp.]